MYDNKNIVCVWYPSGGFGNFINATLTLHGVNFVRPDKTHYKFGGNGDSHDIGFTAPFFCIDDYFFDFNSSDKNYVVLVDNGIVNESKNFADYFPNSKIIKVSYSHKTWPIVAYTSIHKAMNSSINIELKVDQDLWPNQQNWSQREKYFLFLCEHHYRLMWKPESGFCNLLVDDLLDYQGFRNQLAEFGILTTDFSQLWDTWFSVNQQYIAPVIFGQKVINAVVDQQSMDLSQCKDLWTQAVVNYMIWNQFGCVVPANDFADWFVNSDQIVTLLAENNALY
jgi:hypothetical protein